MEHFKHHYSYERVYDYTPSYLRKDELSLSSNGSGETESFSWPNIDAGTATDSESDTTRQLNNEIDISVEPAGNHGLISDEAATSDKNECEKTFSENSSLDTHRESVHLGIVNPCPICGKPFKGKPSLHHHLMSAHAEVWKTLVHDFPKKGNM